MDETQGEQTKQDETKQPRIRRAYLWGSVLAILAILSPFAVNIEYREYEVVYYFMALIWNGSASYFRFVALRNIITFVLPILCLRLAPVFQIARYYEGNSTRKRTAAIILIGDGILLPGNIVALISSLFFPDWLLIPLPIQMIVGLLILWRAPLPEPSRPWEEPEESTHWWQKDDLS